MTETVITVRGEFTRRYPAERATLLTSVAFDGEDRESVVALASAGAEELREHLTTLKANGAIATWSSDRVQVWAERPWNSEGMQLDPVTHAQVSLRAVFTDFDELGRFLTDFATTTGVTLQHIEWELSDATRTTATAEVRSRAVKDAVAKATVFAQSIGLGTVRATALADPGMLGDQATPTFTGGYEPRMLKASDTGTGPALEVNPEDIEVTAFIDARFIAG